jgi:cytochrome c peroxidase
MKKTVRSIALFAVIFTLASCDKKTAFNYYYYTAREYSLVSQYLKLPDHSIDYTVVLPDNLKSVGLTPTAINNEKAVLGRVLFYDKNLSSDGTIACASCHKQELAFSDNAVKSLGVQNQTGARNSLALGSVANFSAYYGTDLFGFYGVRFFWDNRAATATEQCTAAMNNPKEMDMSNSNIQAAVQRQAYYPPLFNKAFGDESITFDRITESISHFINALGSHNSRFDEGASAAHFTYYYPGYVQDFSNFSPAENRGMNIYMSKCSTCHTPDMGRPTLSNANNGLEVQTSDRGVGEYTGLAQDMGTFKVPTLRNITLTAPYMHDGSLKTLEAVIEHYNTGIQPHPNLHNALRAPDQSPLRMNLSNQDKSDLIAFLGTLKDDGLLTDERFSDPFKH